MFRKENFQKEDPMTIIILNNAKQIGNTMKCFALKCKHAEYAT
jgi:hypothetical protein